MCAGQVAKVKKDAQKAVSRPSKIKQQQEGEGEAWASCLLCVVVLG